MNKVTLIGNVGKDVEVKSFENGNKIALTSLATSEHWKDKTTGEKKSATEWHNLVFSGGVVSVVEKYVKRGDKIAIEGKIKNRKWQDKDGNDKYTTEIHCRELHLLTAKETTDKQNPQSAETFSDTIDEMPF